MNANMLLGDRFDPQIELEKEFESILASPEVMAKLMEAYLDTDAGYDAFFTAVSGVCVGADILPKLTILKDEVAFIEAERRMALPPEEEEPDCFYY